MAKTEQFQGLIDRLREAGDHQSFALAAIHDFLARASTEELTTVIENANTGGLDPFPANYLAAMVEHTCAAKAVPPPNWVTTIPALAEPWFATSLKELRLHLLVASPIAFRNRNLFVDSVVGDRV